MQVYNIAKYQNISDRLKRLTSSSKIATQPSEITSPRQIPKSHLNLSHKLQNTGQNTYRLRYQLKQSQSRIPTQQTETNSEQQIMNSINDLINLRSNRQTFASSRQKLIKNVKRIEDAPQHTINQKEQRSTLRRYVQNKQSEDEQKSSLAKIKSENGLKIDQIFANYSNYKQNKQQFIQSINKTTIQIQQASINQNRKSINETSKPQFKKTNFQESAFGEIDNIWNQKMVEQDSAPKFLRSKHEKKDRFAQLSSILNSQFEQKPEDGFEVFGKGKLVIRRLEQKKENEENQQTIKRNIALSPRGLRLPGKICKNNQKSFGVLPNYK